MSNHHYHPHFTLHFQSKVGNSLTNTSKSNLAQPAKLKKLIKICLWMPQILVPAAMKLAEFSNKEIANLSLCRSIQIQCTLPGRSLKGLRAHVARDVPPLLVPPDCTKLCQHCTNPNTIIGIERTPYVHHPSSPNMTCASDIVRIPPSLTLPHQPSADNVTPAKTLASSVTTATKNVSYGITITNKKEGRVS